MKVQENCYIFGVLDRRRYGIRGSFLTVAQQEVDDAFNWFNERTEDSGLEVS
jgi:hypothetical protein